MSAGRRPAFPLLCLSGMLASCAGIPDAPVPDNPTLNDRVFVAGGGFYAQLNTDARLDSETLGLGATVDFEDDLGLEQDLLVPFGGARVRLGDRWRLELEYVQFEREGSETIEVEIQWGDIVFPVDTGLSSRFDLSMLRASLGYAFFRRRDKELGIAFGVHGARIEAELSDGGGTAERGEVLAPLPVLSLYGRVALTERWSVGMRADAFSLEYEQYDGRLLSNAVDLVYQPFRHVALGLGYRDLFVDLELDDPDFSGKVESDFRGPVAFLALSF